MSRDLKIIDEIGALISSNRVGGVSALELDKATALLIELRKSITLQTLIVYCDCSRCLCHNQVEQPGDVCAKCQRHESETI